MSRTKMLILLVMISTAAAWAQSASLDFSLGFPRGEFYNQVRRTALGGTLNFLLFDNPQFPYGVGINVGFYNYGNESRQVPFNYLTPDVTVGVDRTCNLMHFDLMFRLHTTHTLARAYLDLLFGGAYAYTETKVVNNSNSQEIASTKNLDDFVWSYGIGAGVQYRLTPAIPSGEAGFGPLFLDFNVRYMGTSPAEYLKEGGIIVIPNSPQLIMRTSQSRMDLLIASIGVQMYFSLNQPAQQN